MDGLTDVTIFRRPFSEGGEGSRELLYRAAARFSGLSAQCLGPLETGLWGKPFFPQAPRVHCSVTHSGDWWLCALSHSPLGLDLQIHRTHADPARLSRRFFHPQEDQWLAREDYRSFFDLWCAKESLVKYTGRGFHDDPGSFSVVSHDGRFPAMEGIQFRLIPFVPEYSLCLCAQTLGTVRFTDF